MDHRWNEYLPCESSSPVEEVGSFVKPIPKEEQYVSYCSSEMPDLPIEESTTGYATILSKTGPKGGVSMVKSYRQCHPFSDEYSKEAPPTIVSANENETIPPSKGGKENVEQDRNGSIMGLLAQEMPKGLPANERRRRSKPRQRPGMDKYWKLFLTFLVATGCLTISMAQEGAVGSPKDAQTAVWQNCTCFPCMDITCQHLKTIYGPDDTLVYQRNQNENFSECSTISFSPNTRCNVCLGQGIIIICSKPFQWLDVEGDTSEKIYPKACPSIEKDPGNNTTLNSDNTKIFSPRFSGFLLLPLGIFTVAAIVLMVCCCREEASKKSGARNVSVV